MKIASEKRLTTSFNKAYLQWIRPKVGNISIFW